MAGPAPGATPHNRTPTVEALPEVGPRLPRPMGLLPMTSALASAAPRSPSA